jgi:hypothetical protein
VCIWYTLPKKFCLFEGTICCKEETIHFIIKAACVLHNFIPIKQGILSHPKQFETLKYNKKTVKFKFNKIKRDKNPYQRHNKTEKLFEYFMTPAIPYQWNTIIQ